MPAILLKSLRLITGETVDLRVRDTRLVAIGPSLRPLADEIIYDLPEHLVSPPFVESHLHLDSVLTSGQPRPNLSGTLFEGIRLWGERKLELTFEDVQSRARQALQLMAAQGILYVRTHVDVTEPSLVALEALLAVQKQVAPWLTLQIMAFPQDGFYGQSVNEALVEKALQRGANGVGGIPHYELTREDGVQSVQRLFALAEQYDCFVDVHCDKIDDEQSRFLEVLAAQTIRRGWGCRVTASHTTAFHSYNNAYAAKLMGFLERAQLNFVANPLINITLQGRTDSYPKRRGLTRIKELWQQVLNVSFGQDCIEDPWYALGTGNMLTVAHMGAHVGQMMGHSELAACFAMVTTHGARTLGLTSYGLQLGHPANLIILPVPTVQAAIRTQVTPRLVMSQGQIIAEHHPSTMEWHLPSF